MCIICVSPKGAPQPSTDQILTMFQRNPHGAGYMLARRGRVEVHKGFMDVRDLLRQLQSEQLTPDDTAVYHFRIATCGGTSPAMTHPFPLTDDLETCCKLDLYCPCAVAHNGIIHATTDPTDQRYSDTAKFITRYLSRLIRNPADLQDPELLSLVYRLTDYSRLALLDASGYVATVGDFVRQDGLLFSNNTFQPIQAFYSLPRKKALKIGGGFHR